MCVCVGCELGPLLLRHRPLRCTECASFREARTCQKKRFSRLAHLRRCAAWRCGEVCARSHIHARSLAPSLRPGSHLNPCLEQTRIDAAKTGGSRKEEQTTSGRRRRRSRLRSELNQYPSLNTHTSYNFESGNRRTAPRFFDATETLISCSRSRVSKTQSTQFIAFRFFSCRKGELVDLMVVSVRHHLQRGCHLKSGQRFQQLICKNRRKTVLLLRTAARLYNVFTLHRLSIGL